MQVKDLESSKGGEGAELHTILSHGTFSHVRCRIIGTVQTQSVACIRAIWARLSSASSEDLIVHYLADLQ